MAVTPLFSANIADVQDSLRLSGVPITKDAYKQFEDGVLSARLFFYRRIGDTRIAEILVTPLTDNPTTESQRLRALASMTEVKAVKLHLLKHVVTQTVDGSAQDLFGETPFRDTGTSVLESQKRMLEQEIEQDLDILQGTEAEGEEQSLRVLSIDPVTEPPLPGDSIGIIF